MTFSDLLRKAELTPREFADETGFDYRNVVRWCKGAPPPALRDELETVLARFINREAQLPQMVGIRRTAKTGKKVNATVNNGKWSHLEHKFQRQVASHGRYRVHQEPTYRVTTVSGKAAIIGWKDGELGVWATE